MPEKLSHITYKGHANKLSKCHMYDTLYSTNYSMTCQTYFFNFIFQLKKKKKKNRRSGGLRLVEYKMEHPCWDKGCLFIMYCYST